jgi:hypothetical protein
VIGVTGERGHTHVEIVVEESEELANLCHMGLYRKYVLPRLIDLAMRNKDTTRLRAESVPHARGRVLEVGIGSGLNLRFYSSEVQHIYGVDPSVEVAKRADRRHVHDAISGRSVAA